MTGSELVDYVSRVRDALGKDLVDIVLFGSRATGANRPDSDYDVAVFIGDEADLAHSRRAASDAAYPFVLRGLDIRPVVLRVGRRDERSQFLGHIRAVGKALR